MTAYKPDIGEIVEDTESNKIGRVMGFCGPYAQLRPVGGGREWDTKPSKLRPATLADALSASVAAANARSRGECS